MANGDPKDKKRRDRERKKRIGKYKSDHSNLITECWGGICEKVDEFKAKRTRGTSGRRNTKSKKKKFYSAETSVTDAPTYTEESSDPGMDVTHRKYGSNTATKSTDYTPDDSAANIAKVKEIGGSVTSEVGSPTAGPEKTIQGSGLKSEFYTKQLYKKTKSGELKARKGVKVLEKEDAAGEIDPTYAAITRRGTETQYKSTEGMSGKEIRSARKRALDIDPENPTRYVKEKKLERKIGRVERQIERKSKGRLETKPVQDFTHAASDTYGYSYATPTSEAAAKFKTAAGKIKAKKIEHKEKKKEERVENRQDIKQNVKEFAGKVGRGINPFDKGSRDWWADKPFSLKTPKVKGRRRGSGLY